MTSLELASEKPTKKIKQTTKDNGLKIGTNEQILYDYDFLYVRRDDTRSHFFYPAL